MNAVSRITAIESNNYLFFLRLSDTLGMKLSKSQCSKCSIAYVVFTLQFAKRVLA